MIVVDKAIYIFEIKIDGSAGMALDQIIKKEYRQKYERRGLEIISVGVNFDLETLNVSEWKVI